MKTLYEYLIVLAALLSVTPLPARVWHVSPSGSDNYTGTLDEPLRTISRAAYLAVAGDSVLVHEGTYREWVSPEHGGFNEYERIVYMAVPGEDVFIKGSEIVEDWVKMGHGVWKTEVSNQIFDDSNPFARTIAGDWLQKGHSYHLGEVYLDGHPLKEVLDKSGLSENHSTWYAEARDEVTVIYANFGDVNPNKALVEVNARQSCFYPKSTGLDYITVKGFHFSQACPQWAPPTAEQQGMVGPNWSKGWVIEECEISHSKCVGISLGKPKGSGHNFWTIEASRKDFSLHGFNREIEAIVKSEEQGWRKELVGSHLIQNNFIHDCGEAGIVGHLGGIFSTIRHNEITHIAKNKNIAGAETGGIKLHASIDCIIEANCITDCVRGIWLDWQTQGTQVRNNVFSGNREHDLFIEVSHGPAMVYNNLFLSKCALRLDSQGLAFFNNLIQGTIGVHCSDMRYTPYHYAHSTMIKGLANNNGGDVRFYNNIFLGNPMGPADGKLGLTGYDEHPVFTEGQHGKSRKLADFIYCKLPVWASHNLYFNKAVAYIHEQDSYLDPSNAFVLKLSKEGHVYSLDIQGDLFAFNGYRGVPINSRMLGSTVVSNEIFQNTDGTAFSYSLDYWGTAIEDQRIPIGPMTTVKNHMILWKL